MTIQVRRSTKMSDGASTTMRPDVHNDGAGPQLQGSELYFLFLVFESAVGGEYLEVFRLKHLCSANIPSLGK
jgi:hypothetical protein